MKICTECQHEANGKMVDFGIGSYEFWGAPGNDVQWCYVSECCEADMVDENGVTIEPPEEDYDPYE